MQDSASGRASVVIFFPPQSGMDQMRGQGGAKEDMVPGA